MKKIVIIGAEKVNEVPHCSRYMKYLSMFDFEKLDFK